jgi:hypothetical protein
MSKTYKLSVNRAIAAANRFGPGHIDAAEAEQIHRLISGRDRTVQKPPTAVKIPGEGPGVEVATMDAATFVSRLAALGFNVSTAHKLLGMGRSTIYRMSKGQAEVPEVVARLMDMYEWFGIPEKHQLNRR